MGFPVQKNRRSLSSLPLFFIFLLAIILLEKSVSSISALQYYPNGKQPSRSKLRRIEKYLAKVNKPAVLSIDSPDGDIIDCVDKWKQPAFDHPLLKNHTLQSAPRKETEKRGEEIEFSKRVPVQVWHLNGTGCPKDTVPIRRITVEDVLMAKSLRDFIRKRPNSRPRRNNMTTSPNVDDPNTREYATVRAVVTERAFGMGATLNIWNPTVGANEFSLAQLWLSHQPPDENEFHTIEVGWQVYPTRNGGPATKLFVFWTADNYRTGCYDLKCDGFVQTDNFIIPGAAMLAPYSTIGGAQFDVELEVSQESSGGDWWLKFRGADEETHKVGYFSKKVLPLMRDGAEEAEWGGEVVNLREGGQHTRTQMGSGRFAAEGYGRAAYFRQLFVIVNGNAIQPPTETYATNPGCYTVSTPTWVTSPPDMGLHFYYGGPGGAAPNCVNH